MESTALITYSETPAIFCPKSTKAIIICRFYYMYFYYICKNTLILLPLCLNKVFIIVIIAIIVIIIIIIMIMSCLRGSRSRRRTIPNIQETDLELEVSTACR